jgi:hypothetical protein
VDEFCSGSLAAASGILAGLGVVEAVCGSLNQPQQALRRRAFSDARQGRAFAHELAWAYPTRPAWYSRVTDDTVVCRCEEVRAGTIRAAAGEGGNDINMIKRWTRAGMGLCQGRTCQSTVIELIAAVTRRTVQDVGRIRPRPPVRPIPISVLAGSSPVSDR